MADILTAEKMRALHGIGHAFFTRKGGVSTGIYTSLNAALSNGDAIENVTENRRRVAVRMGVAPYRLLLCNQIHSPDVVTVERPWDAKNNPRADAMVTKQKNLVLGVLSADCVPVLFADPHARVIGAAHAGWRGALSGIIENTLAAMEKLGASRRATYAALGPCIWQKSYEVGPEFPAPFLAENPDNQRFFRPSAVAGRYLFNLPGYVEAKLSAAGLASIEPSLADTCADETRFFSYRRNTLGGIKGTGSLISTIVLAD